MRDMASYASQPKRQKQTEAVREVVQQRSSTSDLNESFPGINKIDYQADAAIEETLKYRYYNATEKIQGRTMEDWLRPAVSFRSVLRHTEADVNGDLSLQSCWTDQSDSIEGRKRKLRACFELCLKLGIKLWSLKDTDLLTGVGNPYEENVQHIEELVDYIQDLQNRTNIKLLSFTVDLKFGSRYCSGALTTTDSHMASYVGFKLKRGLDLAQRLGAENFVIRGEQEGNSSILNADLTKEMRHLCYFLKMTADYKKRIAFRGQLLLEPTTETENTSSAYTFGYTRDAFATQTILRQYGLERFYKLHLRPNTDSFISSLFGILGSVSCRGPGLPDLKEATLFMKSTLEHGGLQPGGLGLSLRPWKGPMDARDLFILHVNTLDVYARALRISVRINTEGVFTKNLRQRYSGFNTGWGSRFSSGEASLESCEEEYRKLGQPVVSSARSEHWDTVFNRYLSLA